MSTPQENHFILLNEDEIKCRHLTDEQLLNQTAQCLRILEQRLDNKQTINRQQVHNLVSRKEMLDTIRMIIRQCHGLVSSGKAHGFVFGLITENKTWTASSDNLFRWWKEDINFGQNGPRALAPVISESLGLEALKDLQDSTLASIISSLMPNCTPSQRSAPFYAGRPVSWWPKGTEEWWPRLNILRNSGPPEYKKPHDLRKNSKIAVLIAIIKNFEPNFPRLRRLVAESQSLQNKMTYKENHIWLAVIRGEEMKMNVKLQLSGPDYLPNDGNVLESSGIESDIIAVTDKNAKVEKIDSIDTGDKVGDTYNLPSYEKGESSRANKKRVASDEVVIVNIPTSTTSCSQGSVSKITKASEADAENFRWKNWKEVSIAEPGKNPFIKNYIATNSQDSLSVKNMAREGEDFREPKLKGIHTPEPKRLKLPHWTNPFCRKTHAMQGPMSESTALDGANRKLKEIEVAGGETFKLSNIQSNSCAGKLSCGSTNNLNRVFQFQTNNSASNPSSTLEDYFDRRENKTDQPFASLTPTRAKENFNFCNFITHNPSSNHPYTIKQGSINNMNREFQIQTNNSTFYHSSTTTNINLGENFTAQPSASLTSFSKPTTRGQVPMYNFVGDVSSGQSVHQINTIKQGSVNFNPQVHQFPLDSTKQGSKNINPHFQNQFNLISTEQVNAGKMNYKPRFQNQFQSVSTYHPIPESSQANSSGNHNMGIEHNISSNAADETIMQNLEYEELSFGLM